MKKTKLSDNKSKNDNATLQQTENKIKKFKNELLKLKKEKDILANKYSSLKIQTKILQKNLLKVSKEYENLMEEKQITDRIAGEFKEENLKLKKEIYEKERAFFYTVVDQIQSLKDDLEKMSEKSDSDLEKIISTINQTNEDIKVLKSAVTKSFSGRNKKDIVHLKGKNARVGVFVDVQNMFYSAKKYYDARLDYEKLLEFAVKDRKLVKAIAYLVQTPNIDQSGFISVLQHCKYEVKSKGLITHIDGSSKGNWDIGMAIDMINYADKLDVEVLVSGDGDFVPLVELLKSKGVIVEVIGFTENTSVDLKEVADEFSQITGNLILWNEDF